MKDDELSAAQRRSAKAVQRLAAELLKHHGVKEPTSKEIAKVMQEMARHVNSRTSKKAVFAIGREVLPKTHKLVKPKLVRSRKR